MLRNRRARRIGVLGGVVLAAPGGDGNHQWRRPVRGRELVTSPADGATREPTTTGPAGIPIRPASRRPGHRGTFGQLFKTAVNGSVYGQPLLDDGQVLVNTENNYCVRPQPGDRGDPLEPPLRDTGRWPATWAVPISPRTWGSPRPRWWTRRPTPSTWSTTSTFRVLGSAGVLRARAQSRRRGSRGARLPGGDQGTATNDSQQTFNATYEIQRPGLLLLGGVVYAVRRPL